MKALVPFLLLLPFMATGCGNHDGSSAIDEPPSSQAAIDSLLQRSETTLNSLQSISYDMLRSFTAAGDSAPTHNVYSVLLQPLEGNEFGYRVFARNFGGYHILYDGVTVIAGDPSTGSMRMLDSTMRPLGWIQQSFVSDALIGMHHGSRITEKLRSSDNIAGMRLEEAEWEGGQAQKLVVDLGNKPPVTRGALEIIFRGSDAMPVSLTETLELDIEGKQQQQKLSTSYVDIVLNPEITAGQFTRTVLPEGITIK